MQSWSAKWIALPGGCGNAVVEYRLNLDGRTDVVQVHVSADQRFVLSVDGTEVARGPHRGTMGRWHFHTLDIHARPAELRAVVWSLGHDVAPLAQHTLHHGFLLQGEAVDTGAADWQARALPGYRFDPLSPGSGPAYAGGLETFDATVERGPWSAVEIVEEAMDRWGLWGERRSHRLRPTPLPPMIEQRWPRQIVRHVDEQPADAPFEDSDDVRDWQALLDHGSAVTVPPHSRRRVLLDLGDYACGYDRTTVDGPGATLTLEWAEALCAPESADHQAKGNRGEIAGKVMRGRRQTLRVGEEPVTHVPLWWTSGRYRCVVVETADRPATVSALDEIETRDPLELRSTQIVDAATDAIVPLCFRTLQCCAHETYMDCPYYEQLQYVGDTRLQALVSYSCAGDDRLARHAIRTFADSFDGLVHARYPSRCPQVIPQFALFWIGMVHDFLYWRAADDEGRALVRECMPIVRGVCETFLARRNVDGLVEWPDGWNWVDWVREWDVGSPPGHGEGIVSGINQWQLVYALGLAEELERFAGETALSDRLRGTRDRLAEVTDGTFWDDGVGGWADTPDHGSYSEHAQCYAILSGVADTAKAQRSGKLFDPVDRPIWRGTLYFQHYVFEALHALGRGGEVLERLAPWRRLPARGLCTTPEHGDPVRSDCHAWTAHPLYHLHATLAGVRPAAPGFAIASIRPTVRDLRTQTLHPRGVIDVQVNDGEATVTLPRGVGRAE